MERFITFGDIHWCIQPPHNATISIQQEIFDMIERGVDEHGFGIVPATTFETHGFRHGT